MQKMVICLFVNLTLTIKTNPDMITERMTLQEVESELLTDSENVYNYMETLMKKFRRVVIKSSKFPVCVDKLYTSKRKNKWIIILKASSKKRCWRIDPGICCVLL